jgi:hypothetical protein
MLSLILALATATATPATPTGDVVIDQALSFFTPDEVEHLPRIIPARVRTDQVSKTAEGYTVSGYPAVYIPTWSDVYKAAQHGSREALIKLAAVIAHEAIHVQHGPDERPAYEAEIFMLRRCGAPAKMVDGVRRSMETATR